MSRSGHENDDPLRIDIPHGARIWNYWLGGKDNYDKDREVGDAVRAAFPEIVDLAVKSRQFLVRAVTYLAGEAGIRQFIDLGTGLPTTQNTHEVAQAIVPSARIVYTDNDPLVLEHARALLTNTTPQGITTYVDTDYRDTEYLITEARDVLDFSRPIALLCMGVFGYVPDTTDVRSIITRLLDPLPSGSYLAAWDGTDTSEAVRAGAAAQAELGSPYQLRAVAEIEQWFASLEMVSPGLVPVTQWRPDNIEVGDTEPIDGYGAVARKP